MKKQRIYISGPISYRDPKATVERFEKIESLLKTKGFEVFNPKKNGLPPESTAHQHMHRDLAELTNEDNPYDIIYMMRGWLHSKGCKLEFDAATAIGMSVMFQETGLETFKFE